jgi:hypothetical protein
MRGGEQQERFERQERPQRNQRNEREDRDQRGEQFAQPERSERVEAPRQRRPRVSRDSEDRRDAVNGNEEQRPARFEEPVAEAQQDEPARAERPRRGRRSQSAPAVETVEADRLPAFVTDAPLLAGVVQDEPATEKKIVRRRRPRSEAVGTDA